MPQTKATRTTAAATTIVIAYKYNVGKQSCWHGRKSALFSLKFVWQAKHSHR